MSSNIDLPQHKPGYRPDVDGLRAIAVLAVVVFHLNKTWLPGGFAGVDVFFVISGFLITGILSRRIEARTFSFGEFYLARARRILPATFFCIIITLVVGAIFMLPSDAASLGGSAAASTAWAGNFFFWKGLDTSYFAASSETVPLLHLWSLAVEEQFYLAWPLLLLALARWLPSAGRIVIVSCITVASFALAQLMLTRDPSFAYYLLPPRAGELMVGALASWALLRAQRLHPIVGELLAFIGLGLVTWSIWRLSEADGFPGLWALPPTIGTALLLVSGGRRETVVARVLRLPPFVAVGRISFSLYLWHWPVMAFHRYGYGEPTTLGYAVCVAVMLVMTLLSYFLVEKPMRTASVGSPVWSGVRFAVVGAATAGLGLYVFSSGGGVKLFKPASYIALETDTRPAHEYPFNCQQGGYVEATLSDPRCVLGNPAAPVKTLLWGDSHAAHYVGYVKSVAEHTGVAVRNASVSGCMPLFENSASYSPAGIKDTCTQFNARMREEVSKYDVVVLGSAWTGFDFGDARAEIARTVSELSQRVPHVVIALSAPVFPSYDRKCELKSVMIPGRRCGAERKRSAGFENSVNDYLRSLAAKFPNVAVFDVHELLCEGEICAPVVNGKAVYYDGMHLSMGGSLALGELAVRQQRIPDFLKPAP